MALTLVLSVGFDPELLSTRNLVLQSAGYTVIRALSLKAAVDCLQTLDFDLVLLCQSIPTRQKDRLTSWIRASGSRIPVVSVSDQLFREVFREDAFAGLTVGTDPDALLSGLKEALNNLEIPAAPTAASADQQELAPAATGKLPGLHDSYRGQAKAAQEHFAT